MPLLTGIEFPQANRAVRGGGGEPRAIGAEGHVEDAGGMSDEGVDAPAGRRLPDADDAVRAARGEPLAIRRPRQSAQGADVPEHGPFRRVAEAAEEVPFAAPVVFAAVVFGEPDVQ